MPSFIHRAKDAELALTANRMVDRLNAELANYPGVTQAMVDALAAAVQDYEEQIALLIRKRAEARAQRAARDASRVPVRNGMAKIRNIAKAAGASATALTALGIPTTTAGSSKATVPVVSVDTSQRFQHTIHFADAASPGRKRRPRGALGVEIWVKVGGDQPIGNSGCTFLSFDSVSPYLAIYDAADVGKTAHYILRWHLRDGTRGAWSETYSATITG